MPKLLHSNRTSFATIQIESGDICFISVAQTGVLVRSYKPGFVGSLVGSFIGPILYKEQNVYSAAATAMVLAEQFPQQETLAFNNPVLAAFANAVWHLETPARVAVGLHEAMKTQR